MTEIVRENIMHNKLLLLLCRYNESTLCNRTSVKSKKIRSCGSLACSVDICQALYVACLLTHMFVIFFTVFTTGPSRGK